MNLFGLNISRASKEAISTSPQIVNTNPQGPMTSVFQDYVFRKSSGVFYEQLREGIPIIDAAIRRLISLNGTIKIIGDNPAIVKDLEDFCLSVPVNDTQKGIHSFLENFSNETFEQGFSVSEFVATTDLKDIAGLRVADSKQIIYRRNKAGKAEPWYRYPTSTNNPGQIYTDPSDLVDKILNCGYGQTIHSLGWDEVKLNPANVFYNSINNENSDPYGVSIMRSMEFVSQILMTMQNNFKSNFERFGDPSYHMHYKSAKTGDSTKLEENRLKLEESFTAVVNAKRQGRSGDFVTAGSKDSDVIVKIIGADNKIIDAKVPLRHVLEQIVSKTNLPAWMLGIYWSTTERMATLEVESALQDAKIRQLAMYPEFIRLFSTYLRMRGHKWNTVTTSLDKPGDWGFIFETPNLRDLVAQAQAKFLNAQADMYKVRYGEGEEGAVKGVKLIDTGYSPGSTTSLRSARKKGQSPCGCGCGKAHEDIEITTDGIKPELQDFMWKQLKQLQTGKKEITRSFPWPEMDVVERDYENALKEGWKELEDTVLTILKLDNPEGLEFTFSNAQKEAITQAYENWLKEIDISNDGSPVNWAYSQAYSLGLLNAADEIDRVKGIKAAPKLSLIKNSEVYDALLTTGFALVKDNATTAILDKILPEIEAQVLAGTNPTHVATRLKKIFGDKNSDWDRLARTEMAIASETAKLDEWNEWGIKMVEFVPAPDACAFCESLAGDYKIDEVPLPAEDTHPRCRCSTRPVSTLV